MLKNFLHCFFFLPGGSIGDCMTDQFAITNPGSAGSPVICGPNGGYHSKFLQYLLKTVNNLR